MKIEDCFELGYFAKTHGTKGELLLFLDVDEPLAYSELNALFVELNRQLVPYLIRQINVQGKKAIVLLQNIDHIENAQKLVGKKVYLPLEVLPSLPESDFYYHEVIGFTLVDENKGNLGTVNQIYEGATQDLIGMEYKGKEILIPVVDEIVLNLDRQNKLLHVRLPEGLLEIYLQE